MAGERWVRYSRGGETGCGAIAVVDPGKVGTLGEVVGSTQRGWERLGASGNSTYNTPTLLRSCEKARRARAIRQRLCAALLSRC